jgi:hypothetical protein
MGGGGVLAEFRPDYPGILTAWGELRGVRTY